MTPTKYRVRSLRGGGWHNFDATWVRATIRRRYVPTIRYDELGFRCARVGSRRKVGEKL